MTPKRVSAATVLSLLLACAAVVWAFRYSGRWAGLDFYQFWAGAQVARERDVANLYSMETRQTKGAEYLRRAQSSSDRMRVVAQARREFEFFSTPFLYTTFGTFSGDYERAYLTYRVLLLAAAIGAVLLLGRTGALTWAQTFLLLAFVLVLFEPFKSDIRVGNVNSIQLVVIAAAIFLERRVGGRNADAAAGALYGLVVAFKPNVLPLIPVLFAYRGVRREYRRLATQAAGVAVGIAGAVVAGSMYFRSPNAWLQWLTAARELASNARPFHEGNVAPVQLFSSMFGAPVAYAALAAVLLVIAVAGWNFARASEKDTPLLMAGAALLLYLLSASLVWVHYLLLVLPLSVALMGEGGSYVRRIVAVIGTLFLAGTAWNPATTSGEARLYWFGLGVILCTLIWRLNEREPVAVTKVRRKNK